MFFTRILVAALAVVTASTGAAPATAQDRNPPHQHGRPTAYVIDGRQVFPEGVAFDGRDLYASSKADGTIYRASVRSSTLTRFLPAGADGRTTATGMAVTRNRLVVTGAETGRAWVYDTRTGRLVATFATPDNVPGSSFLNDVTIARDGTAYITDSFRSVIYKIDAKEIGGSRTDTDGLLDPAFDTSAAPLVPGGFNANGITTTPDGQGLLVVYSASGVLYRVDVRTGGITPVHLAGATVTDGDGLVRDGRTLYVIRNFPNAISPIDLTRDGRRGSVGASFTYDGADVPTTAVVVRRRLIVTNSQFDTFFNGAPLTSPVFTLSVVPLPERRRSAIPH